MRPRPQPTDGVVASSTATPKHMSCREKPPHPRHLRGPWVFTMGDGSPVHRDNITHGLNTGARLAGLPAIRPHDLRHGDASQLVMAGTPLRVVQKVLDHAHITTTERYAHLSAGADQAMVEAAFATRYGTITAQTATPRRRWPPINPLARAR